MFTVAAFYQFTPLAAPDDLRPPLVALGDSGDVRGTVLVAPEGINGTIAGPQAGIDAMLARIRAVPGCAEMEAKFSTAQDMPFAKLKVRLKREIVTMRQPQVDPTAGTGAYVEPEAWNDLIARDDVVVIDTRNDYEVAIGTFDGAVDPKTSSFRDFPAWWQQHRDAFAGKKIAMFCTGGIRCEKSTNYLIGEGVSDVFHLKGGILKYLEDVPADQTKWTGACFVFDERVSVTHGLKEGEHKLCRACRRPLTVADLRRPEFEPGVSCHQCLDERSDADRERFRQRQRQYDRARQKASP